MWGLIDGPVKYRISPKIEIKAGSQTLGTATSVGGDKATVKFSVIYSIRLKYTDPDGRTPTAVKQVVKQIELLAKVNAFLYNNREPIQKISKGSLKVAMGALTIAGGIGGGAGIALGSGGTAASEGVKLANVAVVAGSAAVVSGAQDVVAGVTILMSQGNGSRGQEKDQPASKKDAERFARQIEKDLGKDARRTFHDMKESGAPDRTIPQLKEDASAVYEEYNKSNAIPNWMEP
jgi:hypothetical protein